MTAGPPVLLCVFEQQCGEGCGPAASPGLFPLLIDGCPPRHVPPVPWRGRGRVSLSWPGPDTRLPVVRSPPRRSRPVSSVSYSLPGTAPALWKGRSLGQGHWPAGNEGSLRSGVGGGAWTAPSILPGSPESQSSSWSLTLSQRSRQLPARGWPRGSDCRCHRRDGVSGDARSLRIQ